MDDEEGEEEKELPVYTTSTLLLGRYIPLSGDNVEWPEVLLAMDDGFSVDRRLSHNHPHPGWRSFVSRVGDRYSGQVVDGQRHGQGVYHWQSGESYGGHWWKGRMHGEGHLRWNNGDSYSGKFADGRMEGLGIMRLHNGDVMRGSWREDRMTGSGLTLFACGDEHDGWYFSSRPHGHGTYTWRSGEVHSGSWVMGRVDDWLDDRMAHLVQRLQRPPVFRRIRSERHLSRMWREAGEWERLPPLALSSTAGSACPPMALSRPSSHPAGRRLSSSFTTALADVQWVHFQVTERCIPWFFNFDDNDCDFDDWYFDDFDMVDSPSTRMWLFLFAAQDPERVRALQAHQREVEAQEANRPLIPSDRGPRMVVVDCNQATVAVIAAFIVLLAVLATMEPPTPLHTRTRRVPPVCGASLSEKCEGHRMRGMDPLSHRAAAVAVAC